MLQYASICFNVLQSADLMQIIENFIGLIKHPVEITGNPKEFNDTLMKIIKDVTERLWSILPINKFP